MRLYGVAASHVGNVREVNQDRAWFGEPIAVLADGMGGHQGGELAAELAVSQFVDVHDNRDLVGLVKSANRTVHDRADNLGLSGMGTTLVALTLLADGRVSIVNVGDSRAYIMRDYVLEQITEDHSFVEDLVRQGRLTPEEAAVHPQRNIVTRAVGIGGEVDVDHFIVEDPQIGDRYLLCSDGLFNEVSEQEILSILVALSEPEEAAKALIDVTLVTPCRDNVTVLVVDVVEDDDARLEPVAAAANPVALPDVVLPSSRDVNGGTGGGDYGLPRPDEFGRRGSDLTAAGPLDHLPQEKMSAAEAASTTLVLQARDLDVGGVESEAAVLDEVLAPPTQDTEKFVDTAEFLLGEDGSATAVDSVPLIQASPEVDPAPVVAGPPEVESVEASSASGGLPAGGSKSRPLLESSGPVSSRMSSPRNRRTWLLKLIWWLVGLLIVVGGVTGAVVAFAPDCVQGTDAAMKCLTGLTTNPEAIVDDESPDGDPSVTSEPAQSSTVGDDPAGGAPVDGAANTGQPVDSSNESGPSNQSSSLESSSVGG